MRVVLLVALLGTTASNDAQAGHMKDWWTHFCERHLATEDPWQWDELPTHEIVQRYRDTGGRLRWKSTLKGEYHLRALSMSLKWRRQFVSDEEKAIIDEALADYPVKVPPR